MSAWNVVEASAFGTGGPTRAARPNTKPPLALVKLLMLLDRHPNLLNEVRAER